MRRPARPARTAVLAAVAVAVLAVAGVAVAQARTTATGATSPEAAGAPPGATSADSPLSTTTTPGTDATLASPGAAGDPTTPTAATPSPDVRPSAQALTSAAPSPGPGLSAPQAATSLPRALPTESPKASSATPYRFPVPVVLGNATQVVTVKARGTYATVTAYQKVSGTWRAVISTTAARIGSGGLVVGSQRMQGTGTTPTGTYTMTEAFGIHVNPGAKMAYHQVTNDDWWVEDNDSAYYNTMRRASQGGFRTSLPAGSLNSSEHLIDYTVPYTYAVVIDFNRPPNAVRYRGAGIFLHVNGKGATAGCVSVPGPTMAAILLWLDPAQHPRIAIG
jgi:L,D-peptidoglycan transpeptidase YkuD (ErfK/YbiS/YcfS/YnhG family)